MNSGASATDPPLHRVPLGGRQGGGLQEDGHQAMKAPKSRIMEELAPVFLVLLSFVPLFFIGCILDISLTHFFASAKENGAGLNMISRWVYNNMAGFRFLPQEIMTGFWLFMILILIVNLFHSTDLQRFRVRFIYAFLFSWGAALTAAVCIGFACLHPFDLLLARLDATSGFGRVIETLLVVELMMIPIIAAGFFVWKKTRQSKAKKTAE